MIPRRTPLRRSKKPIRRTAFPQRSKPIAKQSKRRRAEQDGWNEITHQRIREVSGKCQLQCSPKCTGIATHGSHRLPQGRGGKSVKPNCDPACLNCHEFVHAHPKIATVLGLMLEPWQASTVIGGTKEIVAAKNNYGN